MVNNFVITQQIPQPPRKLLHLFSEAGDNKIVSVVSLTGRLVVIIFFKYPGFDPHVPEKHYSLKAYCFYKCNGF